MSFWPWGVFIEDFELHDVQQERLAAEHKSRPGIEHFPAVVAIPAADIKGTARLDAAGRDEVKQDLRPNPVVPEVW